MGPAVGRWRIAATATAQPVYIRIKVPSTPPPADPSKLLESTWLPYSPLDCPPPSSFWRLRRWPRVAVPNEPPDRDPRSKLTSSYRSACDGSSDPLRPWAASVRRTRGRPSSLGSLPDSDILIILSFSCVYCRLAEDSSSA